MIMRVTVAISLVAVLALAGCGAKDQNAATTGGATQQQASAATSMTPEELGELGAKIRKSPDRANELLRERGLTEKTFETEIRKVTEDPEASKRYAAAYKKAT
jgi:ABC-type enterochelin transport system substrate-binding protein